MISRRTSFGIRSESSPKTDRLNQVPSWEFRNRRKSFTPRQLARILWDFAYLCWANTTPAAAHRSCPARVQIQKSALGITWAHPGQCDACPGVLFAEIFEVPLSPKKRKHFVLQKRLVCGFNFRRHRERQTEFLCNDALNSRLNCFVLR